MKEHRIDFLGLQETKVNGCSKEEHDGYAVYFSSGITHEEISNAEKIRKRHKNREEATLSEIELYNLDAEKHGVALVCSQCLSIHKSNVRQINGRIILATFDTKPLKTDIVVAYAPHAGRSISDEDTFYTQLHEVLSTLPTHEINLILGDFNVRLMEQLPHEADVLGMHIFRTENDHIDLVSNKQQDNRSRFMDLCHEHNLVVTNTLFEKDLSKLITYRNATTPQFSPPFTTERFAQLDYILINSRWKNAITNVESTCCHVVTSDHKLLIANMRIKLAKRSTKKDTKIYKFRPPNNEQIAQYNDIISQKLEEYLSQDVQDPFDIWAKVLHESSQAVFSPIPAEQKKSYISDETWHLLCQKSDKNRDRDMDAAKELEKQIRKRVRRDKRNHVQSQLEEMDAQGYKWHGLKRLRKKYHPKYTRFRNTDGNYIAENRFPSAAADYLATVQMETTRRCTDTGPYTPFAIWLDSEAIGAGI